MSASSNSAATVTGQQMMLLHALATPENPLITAQQAKNWLSSSRGAGLRAALDGATDRFLIDHGFDPKEIRQGSLFTRAAKNHMGGRRSYANPRSLVRLLYLIDQGLLIDQFSSDEMKRLMYLTRKRIRYASHPALRDSAVYFKSGSLYRCQAEEGYRCRKYQGNRTNQLSSLALVETAPYQPNVENPPLRYIVAVSSNVLKKNSAVAHQTLARDIHRLMQRRYTGG